MENRKATRDEAFFYQLRSICHALVTTVVKFQSLCRHMHTKLEFRPRGKGPYRWHSIPFLYKGQQKDNPPGLHLAAIIYVAASCLFSMQYHFKPTNAKNFCFVCEVGCGELEHSSRL